MDRDEFINKANSYQLINEFLKFSLLELGEIRLGKIINKVNSSDKIKKFLREANRINMPLGSDDFLACIHSSSSFTFAKAEIICIASIILLKKWEVEIGTPHGLVDDIYINNRFFKILDKCDRLKTHVGSDINFFERFNNHLERVVILDIIKNNPHIIKKEISFDSILCGAIKTGMNTVFRVNDNLDEINFSPDLWSLKNYDAEKGAVFIDNYSGETVLIGFPYKLGSIIDVYDSSDPSKIQTKIQIYSCEVQRIRNVNQRDAIKEGYSAYKDKIEELFNEDPSIDAELCLFIKDWQNKYGNSILAYNIWLWAFYFKIDHSTRIEMVSTALELSPEAIERFLNEIG
jgi:hypothetical protein